MSEMISRLPFWATGLAKSYTDIGAALCTKDGRKIGNAVVFAECTTVHPCGDGLTTTYLVITDIGNHLLLELGALEEFFHEPAYICDLSSHTGVAVWLQRHPLGTPEH